MYVERECSRMTNVNKRSKPGEFSSSLILYFLSYPIRLLQKYS